MDYIWIILGIIILAILIYLGFTHLIKNKEFKNTISSTIDLEALIKALGGIENVKEVSSSPSKLTVKLGNEKVDIPAIQNLGASGIVEGNQSLSMIFGKQSPLIAEDLQKKIKERL